MALFGDNKPIVAISTGLKEKSALGIVRVSGFEDLSFLKKLTASNVIKAESRRTYFSKFFDHKGEVLDEGVYIYFKAPKSFTGENVIEFNLHGNPLILQRFCDYLVSAFDFRHAEPGEFSYRALKNEKLNLTQVEGLDLILNANSSFGLSAGTKLLNNDLYRDYKRLREFFLEIKATIELLIDFAEDVGEDEAWGKLVRDTAKFGTLIEGLYKRTTGDINKILSPSIVLVGPTNAGKSTLFNRLVGENRAIVSDVHGTTRDYISEYISINGNSFKLIDTAGLRETGETIEKAGIERSLEIFEKGFYKLFVCNPFHELDFEYYRNTIDSCDGILFTHSDLENFDERVDDFLEVFPVKTFFKSGPMGAVRFDGPIGPDKNDGPIGVPENSGPIGPEDAIGPIGATLLDVISNSYGDVLKDNPIAVDRHRIEISAIYDNFIEFSDTYKNTRDSAVLSSLVNRLGA
jgi:tRNA modification GTPase